MPQAGSQIVWPGCGSHDFDHGVDERARGEVLAGAALHVGGVLLQQALVDRRPSHRRRASIQVSLSIRSTTSRWSLAGSWILFCALRKMVPSMPVLPAEFLERVAVVDFEIVAVELRELVPAQPSGSATAC